MTSQQPSGTPMPLSEKILRSILSRESFFISDIARETDTSLTTAIKYLNRMIQDGYVVPLDKPSGQGKGRRSVRYGVNPGCAYFVGVDVQNFGLSIGLMNFSGEIIRSTTDSSFRFENTFGALEYVCTSVLRFIDGLAPDIDKSRIATVCIALSGRVNTLRGTSASIFAFENLGDLSLADFFTERLGYPVIIENDTKTKAWGEYTAGLSKRFSNLLYVNISWGLGLCIIIDGKIYRGMNGFSGELGHIHAFDNNVMCHCGKKGCLETEVSGRAVARILTGHILDGEKSILSPVIAAGKEITMDDIIRALDQEDPLTQEIIDTTGQKLGEQIAMLINLFNPEAVVIGGSMVCTEVNYLMYSLKISINKYALKIMSRGVEILTSRLRDKAGITGACMLARQHAFKDL